MTRAVIHPNVADFAVAVERQMDCRLKDRPVIISRAAAARAVVYDMSEEAYLGGIRKGMPLDQAMRRMSDATVLMPHPDRYERAMGALLKRVLPYAPFIEPGEDDGHLFLDLTGTRRLFGPPADVAWRLQREIRADLGLDSTLRSVAAHTFDNDTNERFLLEAALYALTERVAADWLHVVSALCSTIPMVCAVAGNNFFCRPRPMTRCFRCFLKSPNRFSAGSGHGGSGFGICA